MLTQTMETPEMLTDQVLRDKVIHFSEGLPGFTEHREFLMAQRPEEKPFAWMKSVADPSLTFAVVSAYAWKSDFILEVDDDILGKLGSIDPRDYGVYFILRIHKKEGRTTLTANLDAPVLVNIRQRQAAQVIVPANIPSDQTEALSLQL